MKNRSRNSNRGLANGNLRVVPPSKRARLVHNDTRSRPKSPSSLRLDPTRTITLRRQFITRLRKQFARLKTKVIELVVKEDAFGLNDPTKNSNPEGVNQYSSGRLSGWITPKGDHVPLRSEIGGVEQHETALFQVHGEHGDFPSVIAKGFTRVKALPDKNLHIETSPAGLGKAKSWVRQNVDPQRIETVHYEIHRPGLDPVRQHETLTINCRPGQIRDEKGRCGPGIGVEIPREQMPQIPGDRRQEFITFCNSHGVLCIAESRIAEDLSPTQSRFRQERVDSIPHDVLDSDPIIVSDDDYILDGTHRWVKAWQLSPQREVRVLRIALPLQEALALMRAFPAVKYTANHQAFIAPIPDSEGYRVGWFQTQNLATNEGQDSLIEVPDIRQHDHYSCGAASAMAVGKYYGVGPDSIEEWKKALGTDVEESTSPGAIFDYLQKLGLQVEAYYNLSLDDLREYWEKGWPVITPVQDYGAEVPGKATFAYGHYLTVIGVAMGYVFCQDSSADNVLKDEGSDAAPGKVMIEEQDFLDLWDDRDISNNEYVRFGIAVGPKVGVQALISNTDPAEGKWITIQGTHVLVKDGRIIQGPDHLKGLKPYEAQLAHQRYKADELKKSRSTPDLKSSPAEKVESSAEKGGSPKEAIKKIVDDNISKTSVGLPFDEIYSKAKESHPGLTKEQFKKIASDLHDEGTFRLGGWGRMLDDVPDKDLILRRGGEEVQGGVGKIMYSLRPIGNANPYHDEKGRFTFSIGDRVNIDHPDYETNGQSGTIIGGRQGKNAYYHSVKLDSGKIEEIGSSGLKKSLSETKGIEESKPDFWSLPEEEYNKLYEPVGKGKISLKGIKDISIHLLDNIPVNIREDLVSREGDRVKGYELRKMKISDIVPSQHGWQYDDESSRGSAKALATGDLSKIAKADLAPIRLNGDGKTIADGNHRHAAASFNGQKHIYAWVPKKPITNSNPYHDVLGRFAAGVNEAAASSPTGKFGDNKTFISHVHEEYNKGQQAQGKVGQPLEQFKNNLLKASKAGLVTLSRADLPHIMNPKDVDSSAVKDGNAEFHFVMHGGVRNTNPNHDEHGRFSSGPSTGLVSQLKSAGAAIGHIEHLAKTYVSDKIGAGVAKLPRAMQSGVHAAFSVGKVGTAAAFITWKTGQALAEKVAQERGATEEEARRLRGVLSSIDMTSFKPLSYGLHVSGVSTVTLGLTSLIPPATASYLAYSTAKNPLATARAAGKLVKETAQNLHKKLYVTLNTPEAWSALIYDSLKQHNFSDWYIALLSAAMDGTQGCYEALEIANKAWETQSSPTVNTGRWSFNTSSEQIDKFQEWLREQFDADLLGDTNEQVWEKYIQDGFKKGAGRAFDDVNPKTRPDLFTSTDEDSLRDFYAGTKQEFLRSAFAQPETIDKVKLLAGRTFDDLVGCTDDMATKLSRALSDGLIQGKGPRDIAGDLTDQIDISQNRAETIARTEIIRAHAEGQLEAFDKLGVAEVGVDVEWSTAGDGRVCDECAPLEGTVMSIEEAHGMIPFHPNCRCAFLPHNKEWDDEDKEGIQRRKDEVNEELGVGVENQRVRRLENRRKDRLTVNRMKWANLTRWTEVIDASRSRLNSWYRSKN